MTDNEIIKALECCSKHNCCNECPNFHTLCEGDSTVMVRKALDLINRQKAEIERLNSCVKSEDEIRAIMKDQMTPMVCEIVNEQIDRAIKLTRIECALKVKNNRNRLFNTIYSDLFFCDKIDELWAEMESASKCRMN